MVEKFKAVQAIVKLFFCRINTSPTQTIELG